jgi:hypothetical protein
MLVTRACILRSATEGSIFRMGSINETRTASKFPRKPCTKTFICQLLCEIFLPIYVPFPGSLGGSESSACQCAQMRVTSSISSTPPVTVCKPTQKGSRFVHAHVSSNEKISRQAKLELQIFNPFSIRFSPNRQKRRGRGNERRDGPGKRH